MNYCLGVSIEFPPGEPGSPEYRKARDEDEPVSKLWAEKFRRWGINTSASVRGNWNNRFPTTPIFRCVNYLKVGKVPPHPTLGFHDPYSDRFREVVEAWGRRVLVPQRDNRLIIGWFIDNEFHLPQDEAFQEQFYKVVTGVMKKYAPHHLILGTRHEYPNRSELDLRMEGKYCDVLTANCYMLEPDRGMLERMHRLSGRPLLVGEFALAAKDSGLPNPRSHINTLFETQADRAKAYQVYTEHAAAMPFMVGTHYFMLFDKKEILPNNWGLRDIEGNVYEDFVAAFPDVHRRLPLIHAGKLKPKRYPEDYPGFAPAFNDAPGTEDQATFAGDGAWLWQPAFLHYACTPGTGPFFFERDTDESWGYEKDGFIEYRFTMRADMQNVHLLCRYATYPNSHEYNRLIVDVNGEQRASLDCPVVLGKGTSPKGWAYGYGALKLGTVAAPLNVDLAGDEPVSIRLRVERPWRKRCGVILHGFFLSAGPARVRDGDYYALEPVAGQ